MIKVLAQAAPSATTETDVYTVPNGYSAAISTVVVCNRDTAAGTYRVYISPAGAATSNEMYFAYDTSLGANASVYLTIGATLAETDVLRAYCSTANFSVNVFGIEVPNA